MFEFEMIDKDKLLKELEFLRKHYNRLAELMGVKSPIVKGIGVKGSKYSEYKLEHEGKVKFIDYLILRIKDKDFE